MYCLEVLIRLRHKELISHFRARKLRIKIDHKVFGKHRRGKLPIKD